MSGPVTACSVCGSPDLTVILDMGEQPLAERFGHPQTYPLALQECGNCTLAQLTYAVDQREVFPLDHPYTSGNTKALVEHFMRLSNRVGRYLADGDLAVDIGANDTTLLSLLRAAVRKVAVEPTDQVRKARGDIRAWQAFWTAEVAASIGRVEGPAKVITACNVLAHVPDPHDFVKGVADLLADDGVFVTENHHLSSVVDGLQVDAVYHEHLRYFSPTSLARLLGAHGLTIVEMETIPTHGGSFRTFARKSQTATLRARAWKAKTDLWHLLAGIHERGEAIYGVGATTRATGLIHYAGIGKFLPCVVEVPGSEKIGHQIPGTFIAIRDEAVLIEDQPEYALILSWHLAGPIVKSLRAKGYKGRFLVPLPSARILDA